MGPLIGFLGYVLFLEAFGVFGTTLCLHSGIYSVVLMCAYSNDEISFNIEYNHWILIFYTYWALQQLHTDLHCMSSRDGSGIACHWHFKISLKIILKFENLVAYMIGLIQLFIKRSAAAYGVTGSDVSMTRTTQYGSKQIMKAQKTMKRFLVTCRSRRDILFGLRNTVASLLVPNWFMDSTLTATDNFLAFLQRYEGENIYGGYAMRLK